MRYWFPYFSFHPGHQFQTLLITLVITHHELSLLNRTCMVAADDQFVGDSLYFPRGAEVHEKLSCEWPSIHAYANTAFSYNLRIEGQHHPFIQNDEVHMEGFHDTDQLDRIRVNTTRLQNALFVTLTIRSVTTEDSGTYILTTKLYLPPYFNETYVIDDRRKITVTVPPYKAHCAITLNQNEIYLFLISCTASPADMSYLNVTRISCLQKPGAVIAKNMTMSHDNVSVVFGIQSHAPVACCSHETYKDPTMESCKDFVWPYECSRHISWSDITTSTEGTCPAITCSSHAIGLKACAFATCCLMPWLQVALDLYP